jgi:hypothetical protein
LDESNFGNGVEGENAPNHHSFRQRNESGLRAGNDLFSRLMQNRSPRTASNLLSFQINDSGSRAGNGLLPRTNESSESIANNYREFASPVQRAYRREQERLRDEQAFQVVLEASKAEEPTTSEFEYEEEMELEEQEAENEEEEEEEEEEEPPAKRVLRSSTK